jgi:hypothetical protein
MGDRLLNHVTLPQRLSCRGSSYVQLGVKHKVGLVSLNLSSNAFRELRVFRNWILGTRIGIAPPRKYRRMIKPLFILLQTARSECYRIIGHNKWGLTFRLRHFPVWLHEIPIFLILQNFTKGFCWFERSKTFQKVWGQKKGGFNKLILQIFNFYI